VAIARWRSRGGQPKAIDQPGQIGSADSRVVGVNGRRELNQAGLKTCESLARDGRNENAEYG